MKDLLTAKTGSKKPLDTSLYELLMENRYTVKDIRELNPKMTYRTVNHWAENGYLLSQKNDGDWRKFNFAEYIWFLFLNELRELNASFKHILPVILLDLGIRYNEWDNLDQSHLNKIKKLPWEKFIAHINKETALENFCWELVKIISYKTPITLRFIGDRLLYIYGNPAYHGIKLKPYLEKYRQDVEESNFHSSISISLDSLIKDFIDKKDLDNIIGLNLLTKQEVEIIEQVRNGDLKEVTIFMEDGKPTRMKLTDEINNVDAAKRIKENFFTDYQACEYVTNGGATFSMRRTTGKILSK
jgi:hypothetical protein